MTGDRGSPAAAPDEPLILSLDSFEGPLDLLLDLARRQKIDLARISILQLVDQYLAYIGRAGALRLSVAADYLVMAATLLWLKSALLLPRPEAPDPDPLDVEARLRWRLHRLDAMRRAAEKLVQRDLLGRDVFRRGAPEGLRRIETSTADASLHDLLAAWGGLVRRKQRQTPWQPHDRGPVVSLDEALQQLQAQIATTRNWTALSRLLPASDSPELARSRLASSFVAALELARTGRAELKQDEAFAPLYVKAPE